MTKSFNEVSNFDFASAEQRIRDQDYYADDEINLLIASRIQPNAVLVPSSVTVAPTSSYDIPERTNFYEALASFRDQSEADQLVSPINLNNHFAGLHIARDENGKFQATYVDPMGTSQRAKGPIESIIDSGWGFVSNLFGIQNDDSVTRDILGPLPHSSIPRHIIDALESELGITAQEIVITNNRLQHSNYVESNVPNLRNATNNHCGAFTTEILVSLANERMKVSNNRLIENSESGFIDVADHSESQSEETGLKLRWRHAEILRKIENKINNVADDEMPDPELHDSEEASNNPPDNFFNYATDVLNENVEALIENIHYLGSSLPSIGKLSTAYLLLSGVNTQDQMVNLVQRRLQGGGRSKAPSFQPSVQPSQYPISDQSQNPTFLPSVNPTTIIPTFDPSTINPSSTSPSTAIPSSAIPTTDAPTTSSPSTDAPSTTAPSSTNPTNIPSSTSPTTTSPSTGTPSTTAPSSTNPTNIPSSTSPTTTSPSTAMPSTDTPSTTAPSSTNPTNIPSSTSPTTTSPSTAIPSSATPSTSTPSSTNPTNIPSSTSPTTSSPSTAMPSTDAPSTTSPSSTNPTNIPSSTSPSTAIPSSATPSTTTPSSTNPTNTPSSTNPTTCTPAPTSPITVVPTSDPTQELTVAPTLSPSEGNSTISSLGVVEFPAEVIPISTGTVVGGSIIAGSSVSLVELALEAGATTLASSVGASVAVSTGIVSGGLITTAGTAGYLLGLGVGAIVGLESEKDRKESERRRMEEEKVEVQTAADKNSKWPTLERAGYLGGMGGVVMGSAVVLHHYGYGTTFDLAKLSPYLALALRNDADFTNIRSSLPTYIAAATATAEDRNLRAERRPIKRLQSALTKALIKLEKSERDDDEPISPERLERINTAVSTGRIYELKDMFNCASMASSAELNDRIEETLGFSSNRILLPVRSLGYGLLNNALIRVERGRGVVNPNDIELGVFNSNRAEEVGTTGYRVITRSRSLSSMDVIREEMKEETPRRRKSLPLLQTISQSNQPTLSVNTTTPPVDNEGATSLSGRYTAGTSSTGLRHRGNRSTGKKKGVMGVAVTETSNQTFSPPKNVQDRVKALDKVQAGAGRAPYGNLERDGGEARIRYALEHLNLSPADIPPTNTQINNETKSAEFSSKDDADNTSDNSTPSDLSSSSSFYLPIYTTQNPIHAQMKSPIIKTSNPNDQRDNVGRAGELPSISTSPRETSKLTEARLHGNSSPEL